MTKFETNARTSETGLATARRAGRCLAIGAESPALRAVAKPGLASRVGHRGFTLIELMISIALVLFLILGVNQVFQYTTQAVGAGEAINAAIRSSRAAEATFAGDFADIVPPGGDPTASASLIINMMQAYAYRDARDLAAQGASAGSAPSIQSATGYYIPPGAPYLDLNGTGTPGDPTVNGDVVYPYTYNSRSHRLDVLSFFARGLFHRQTGNPGTYVDDMSATEAWIWYGHLQLPDNGGFDTNIDFPHNLGGTDTFPAGGTTAANNPNNFFASQFVLGRVMTLLVPKYPNTSAGAIYDQAGNAQWFIDNNQNALDPLGAYSKVNQSAISSGSDTGPYHLPDSRVDLAATSIAGFRSSLLYAIANNPNNYDWWDLMMDGNPNYSNNQQYTRFKCNPYLPKPMQSVNMAFANPYFLGGCSQFIVEYAGDYLTQDNNPSDVKNLNATPPIAHNYGDIISPGSDGQIDYVIVNDPVNNVPVKKTIWYGLPRSTSQQGTISTANGDVMPLYVYLHALGFSQQNFEKNPLPGINVNSSSNGSTPTIALTSMQAGSQYTCAWGPYDTKPKLIRITMTLDDPTGRLPAGQTYQYVFAVP